MVVIFDDSACVCYFSLHLVFVALGVVEYLYGLSTEMRIPLKFYLNGNMRIIMQVS